MPVSMDIFHYNPIKFGAIMRQYAKEHDISQASLSRHTGYTYDTVGNYLSGKVRGFPYDFVAKACKLFGVPMDVFDQLMLQGEDVDFDDLLITLSPHGEPRVIPASDIPASVVDAVVPDTVAAVASAIAAVPDPAPAPAPAVPQSSPDCASALLARADQHHADMVAQLIESRRLLIEQHDKEIETLRAQIDRQDQLIRDLLDRLSGGGGNRYVL